MTFLKAILFALVAVAILPVAIVAFVALFMVVYVAGIWVVVMDACEQFDEDCVKETLSEWEAEAR
jgi:hypothetical protein